MKKEATMARRRREAFYVDGTGADPDLLRQGLTWLIEKSKATGASTAYLVIPKMSQLRMTAADVLGEPAVQTLQNGRPVPLTAGVQLVAYSEQTLRRNYIQGPVLAFNCTPKEMTQIDLASEDWPVALIAFTEEERRQWVAKHQARKIGDESDDAAGPPRLSNPVVERALQHLTERVNLSDGIGHKLDRDKAIYLFRILKRNHEEVNFDELPGWFVANNWRSNYADELTQLGRDIYAGKRLQAGIDPWGSQAIKVWRREAAEMAGAEG
jgi:hypothetical protein